MGDSLLLSFHLEHGPKRSSVFAETVESVEQKIAKILILVVVLILN